MKAGRGNRRVVPAEVLLFPVHPTLSSADLEMIVAAVNALCA